MIRSHYGILFALQLFLPGDFWTWLPRHLAQKAGCFTHKNSLLGGAAVYGGKLDVSWEGGLECGGRMQGGLCRDWTGVWPGQVVPVGRLNKKLFNLSQDVSKALIMYNL